MVGSLHGSFAIRHRPDVFAFGALLYEVLTGANPFASPRYADTIHNVVHLAPPMERVPVTLRRIVARCLRKEPALRYDSLRDAALDLREAVAEVETSRIPPRTVALLHTHPYGERRPSRQDREEARRLGFPVLVVTTEAVVAARPDGAEVTLARGGWSSR